jgi:hypothetical protein
MQLHAACAALPACCLRLSCFCLLGLKGMGATRHTGIESQYRVTAARYSHNIAKAAQCSAAKNGARQRPSPGRRVKASSGERRGFA